MLCLSNLNLSFGSRTLLRNVNLELSPGVIGVLTGVNGCGKSSLLNCISGVIPSYIKADISGRLMLDGFDLSAIPLYEKFRYLWYSMANPSRQFFFPTCEAELAFALENMGLPADMIRQRIESALERFHLSRELLQSPFSLSGGQRSLLLCAMAEALDAKLFLLDEPSAGLSEASLVLLGNWLADLKRRNKIVLLAEHNAVLIAHTDMEFELSQWGIA